MSQTDLFYPDHPGCKERGGTSEQAARETGANRAASLRAVVLNCLQHRPRTADEVASALGMSVLSIRPRFSELLARQKIEPTGERRRNASGKLAKVWRAA